MLLAVASSVSGLRFLSGLVPCSVTCVDTSATGICPRWHSAGPMTGQTLIRHWDIAGPAVMLEQLRSGSSRPVVRIITYILMLQFKWIPCRPGSVILVQATIYRRLRIG